MNETIRFQTNRWLKDISARHVWNQLRISWIDIYLRSSDMITTDADKQFVAREFKQYAINMKITIKTTFVETHHSIEMMKRYHDSFRRMYAIITTEISNIDLEIALQMTFKVINESIELDELIFILLMFDVYFQMIEMNVSSSTIIQRAIAMKKTMKEVHKFIAIRQMNDVLNTSNDSISLIHNLLLNSSVLIFRESKDNQSETWKESFKLLSIQSESAIIELSNVSTKFRFISLKSYYQSDDHINDELSFSSTESSIESSVKSSIESSTKSSVKSSIESISEHADFITIDSIILIASIKRDRGRLRKFFSSIANFIFNTIDAINLVSSFIASRKKEIVDLLEKEIFILINKRNVSTDVRIVSFRFVNEIQHSEIEKDFDKFR